MRSLVGRLSLGLVLSGLLLVGPGTAQSARAVDGDQDLRLLDLPGLVAEAIARRPGILAAEAGLVAAHEEISQAGSLPDPMVAVAYQNDGWDRITFGDRPMSNLSFTVSQKFPFPGKRNLRRETAVHRESVSASRVRVAGVDTVRLVRERYVDLARTGETLRVLRVVLQEIERVEEIATTRYGAGLAGLPDVLMAQTQKYRVLERIQIAEDERRRAAAGLWQIVGREPTDAAGPALPVALPLPAGNVETIEELAEEFSPAVETGRNKVRMAEAARDLAKRNRYPDLTVMGMYAARNSSDIHDLWRVGFGTTIPLFYKDKQKAAVRKAEAELEATRQELEEIRQMIRASARREWSAMGRAEELMDLYDGGLKQKSLEGLEASLTAYRNGKADMTMVIRNLVDSMNAEIGYWKHYAMRQMAVARLGALAGVEGGGGS